MNKKVAAVLFALAVSISLIACTAPKNSSSTAPSEPVSAPAGPLLTLDPATTGSISGTVTLAGDPPPPRTVNMSIDPFCKQPASGPAVFPDVVSGDHGRVANVVIYVKSGLGNYHFGAPPAPVSCGSPLPRRFCCGRKSMAK